MPPITRKVPTPTKVADIETSHGTAQAHIFAVHRGVPRASLILGQGAGSGTVLSSPDLATLADELPGHGIEVVLVEQPWKVAGNPVEPAADVLHRAWIEIVADLRRSGIGLRRLALGGRSGGARVACRTAELTKPACLVCLAFPLIPPRKAGQDRASELAAAAAVAPVTVVQGTEDKYGGPADVAALVAKHGQRVLVVAIPFLDHSFDLKPRATVTDSEIRLILVEATRRTVLRAAGNTGPLLAR